jgi:hypothetical protein
VKKFAIASLFALQLIAGCGVNSPVLPASNPTLSASVKSMSSDISEYKAIAYQDFRKLWDRTCGCDHSEDPTPYNGKKYAISAILEYEKTSSFIPSWHVVMYDPSGKSYGSGFYGIKKTFLSENQADKYFLALGAVRADIVHDGGVNLDTGSITVKKHAKATPVTVYFVFKAHIDGGSLYDTMEISAVKTPSGNLVKM